VLSVESFLYSVTMIWAFPLFGVIAEQRGWLPAYAVAAGLLVVALGVFLLVSRSAPIRRA
jgi:hypothetical protein